MGFPLQMILVKIMLQQRRKGVVITDQRVRLTTEVKRLIMLDIDHDLRWASIGPPRNSIDQVLRMGIVLHEPDRIVTRTGA